MTKYILDTNFLARILIQDNSDHVKHVLAVIDSALDKNIELFVDKAVLFELVYVLTGNIYQLTRLEVFNSINSLLELNCFTFENLNTLLPTLATYRDTTLDIVDCYLIQKAVIEDYEFHSFDKKANKVYEAVKATAIT